MFAAPLRSTRVAYAGMASHSNLYVRGWTSPEFGEADLVQLFSQHGEITSLRMVAGGEAGQQAPHAFVKYELPAQVGRPGCYHYAI